VTVIRIIRPYPMRLPIRLLAVALLLSGLAFRSTLAAIARGEHTPNLIAAAAAAFAAAFIIGLNISKRRSG
jgi:hypothetical protein